MSNFRPVDRDTSSFLLPPSVDDWLPKDHLARFVIEIVERLDLSALTLSYRGAGSAAAYHPSMLLSLLIYYATGTYGSRRIEQTSYDSVAFRYIAANTHPDHDTLCAFRKRFLSGSARPSSTTTCSRPSRSCTRSTRPGDVVAESGAGISCRAEDADAIAAAILEVRKLSHQERKAMGRRGLEWITVNRDYAVLAKRFLAGVLDAPVLAGREAR